MFDLGCCHFRWVIGHVSCARIVVHFPKSGEEGQGCKGVLLQSSSSVETGRNRHSTAIMPYQTCSHSALKAGTYDHVRSIQTTNPF